MQVAIGLTLLNTQSVVDEVKMSEFESILLMVFMYVQGIILGYVLWAPMTPFKRGLIDGLSLKFIWSRK